MLAVTVERGATGEDIWLPSLTVRRVGGESACLRSPGENSSARPQDAFAIMPSPGTSFIPSIPWQGRTILQLHFRQVSYVADVGRESKVPCGNRLLRLRSPRICGRDCRSTRQITLALDRHLRGDNCAPGKVLFLIGRWAGKLREFCASSHRKCDAEASHESVVVARQNVVQPAGRDHGVRLYFARFELTHYTLTRRVSEASTYTPR
jgi:hypothetical protein